MLNKIFRLFNYLKLKYLDDTSNNSKSKERNTKIPDSTRIIKEKLQNQIFSDSNDFILRKFNMGKDSQIKLLITYFDGLVDRQLISNDILKSLMVESRMTELDAELNQSTILNILKENLISVGEVKEVKDFKETINAILAGDTIIYINGRQTALRIGTRGWESRGVEEPNTESVVRGPRAGFTETLRTNTALLRRKVKSPKLKSEMMTLGEYTNTEVCICYIKDLAHNDLVETVKQRLKQIKTDSILESGYIEEFVEDAPYSIFSTVGNAEKPDVVAGKILEGRVAILCDGTPFVLTVPRLFIENFHSSEDYYTSPFFATLTRMFRCIAIVLTIALPGFYVASVNFHQDLIPFKLLLTITSSREGIPFSAFTETFLMGLAFQLLQEAGVRMPRPIGQAVSIVGGLVLGRAAVDAGIASNPIIMITALTAITSFILPSLRGVLPIVRIIVLIVASILGFMGMALVILAFFIHLCTIRSCGVPYLAPLTPVKGMDLKDSFIRVPIWSMWMRPMSLMEEKREQPNHRMEFDIRKRED
ncbi:spore germination protein [Halanaerobaculum tunisiense]